MNAGRTVLAQLARAASPFHHDQRAPQLDIDTMLELGCSSQFMAMGTADHWESVTAFREKKEPVFKGE